LYTYSLIAAGQCGSGPRAQAAFLLAIIGKSRFYSHRWPASQVKPLHSRANGAISPVLHSLARSFRRARRIPRERPMRYLFHEDRARFPAGAEMPQTACIPGDCDINAPTFVGVGKAL
jgi:hypothetical protein